MTTTHTASVVLRGGARYPFVPTCSCGWESRGFLTSEAAQLVAEEHEPCSDALAAGE